MYKNKYLKYKNKYLQLKGGVLNSDTGINWSEYEHFKNKYEKNDGYINSKGEKIYVLNSWIDFFVNVITYQIPDKEDIEFILNKFFKDCKRTLSKEFLKYCLYVTFTPDYYFKVITGNTMTPLEIYLLMIHNIKFTDTISQELIISIPILQKIYNENHNDLIWQKWVINKEDETELIKQITQYYDNLLLEPILPIKPAYNFIMQEPVLNIGYTNTGQPQDIGRMIGTLTKRITTNLLPLTHVLLLNNVFLGIYYYDVSKHNKDHLESLKEILLSTYENKYKLYQRNDILTHIHNIKSEDYWKINRYFVISELHFSINNNDNLTIISLNGGLLEKGCGHLFLCLFLNLIRDIFNEEMLINLHAATIGVIEKFYNKIGFNCNNKICDATIKNLIKKCNEKNKNNFDNIQIMLKIKDIYYNNLTDIKEPMLKMLK